MSKRATSMPAVAVCGRDRLESVDAVRGLAIVLMVLDHVLVQVDPDSFLRTGSPASVTRLALPLFMLASAAVWSYRPWWRRLVQLGPVVVLEAALYAVLEMPQPGIVWVYLLVIVGIDTAWYVSGGEAGRYVLGVLGLVQALYVPINWDGYQPGLVLAWWCLGRMAWRADDVQLVYSERSSALQWIGRRPRLWYVGHLTAIAVVMVAT